MKTITPDQYLQLLGLQVLAKEYDKQLEATVEAMARILGEEYTKDDAWGGRAGDLAIGGESVIEVLSKLGIIIAKPEDA